MARLAGQLDVFLNSRLVGRLSRASSGAVDFQYDPTWLVWDHTLPISLSLPLRERRYIGAPVLAVFDNLLPDNDGLRRRIATRVGAGGTDAYSLLEALGRDCVGALQFFPSGGTPPAPETVAGEPVSDDEIARVLDGLALNPLGLDRETDFRISIAGAQKKTALLRWDGHWLRPTGATPTTHIFKQQIGKLPNGLDLSDSVKNEYLCLKLTAALGVPSTRAEIATFGAKNVLIVERFDRLITQDKRIIRVPQEDCCQALAVPWTQKYESDGGPGIPAILRLLAGSDMAAFDQRSFLKVNIIFWLLGATDGHAKNFSLFLSPGGGYRLTPIYDVVSAEPSLVAHQLRHTQMKLAMAVGNNRHYQIKTIAPHHFVESAILGGVGRNLAMKVIEELASVGQAAFDATVAALPAAFPEALVAGIAKGFAERLRLLSGAGGAGEA